MALEGLRSALSRLSVALTPVPTEGAMRGDPVGDSDTGAEAIRCPSCGRTIAKGSGRCEGCGQRLLLDLPASKATMIIGAGVLAGFVVGGALVGLTLPRQANPGAAAVSPGASTPGATVAPSVIPGAAIAALRGTTALNGRIVAQADPLAKALASKTFSSSDVIGVLRDMSVDTRAGAGMVASFGGWAEAGEHQAALAAFYESLATEIDTGLAASVRSTAAYKATTKRIVALLKQIGPLDVASRDLASRAGITLPLVTIPKAAR